jgi:hypothetical protein
VVDVLSAGSGRSLDPAPRKELERRFGHDFGQVRVHTDDRAADSARRVGALAYTVGNHIVFGGGQYRPTERAGGRLLAHELTHALQQSSSSSEIPSSEASTVTTERGARPPAADSSGQGPRPAAMVTENDGPVVSRQFDRSSMSSPSSGGTSGGRDAGTPDAGTSDASAAAASACRIDVRATHIGGFLSSAPVWHLFVVATDTAGTESFYRGGPGGPGAPPPYGSILTTHGPYLPGTVDWEPGAPSVTVASGAAACGKGSCFVSELSRIDGTATPYAPLGPNSNTVARSLLSTCGVPERKPVILAPGWGDSIP